MTYNRRNIKKMTRRVTISDDSFGLLEHMSPLTIDDIILLFSNTYVGIALANQGKCEAPVVEKTYAKIQHLTLTIPEYEKLCKKYKPEAIDVIIKDMQNYANLKKYKSAYLTINKWLSNRGKEVLAGSNGSVEFGSEEWKRRNE